MTEDLTFDSTAEKKHNGFHGVCCWFVEFNWKIYISKHFTWKVTNVLQALKSQVKEQLDELPSEENLHLMVDNLTAQVPGLEYLGDTIKEGLAILPDKDEVNNDEKQIDESCNELSFFTSFLFIIASYV